MKIGFSLLLQQYLGSAEVGYADCRDFQLVCPACHEAVFKSGGVDGPRQYLSHYASTMSSVPDCELRVASTGSQRIIDQNAVSRGQHLDLFQRVFRDALLVRFCPDPLVRLRAEGSVQWMNSRASFRDMIRDVRTFLTRMVNSESRDIIFNLDEIYSNMSPFWRNRQKGYANSFLDHLVAPNSFKSLSFAMAAGFIHQRGVFERRGAFGPLSEYAGDILQAMTVASDRDLGRFLAEAATTGTDEHAKPGSRLAVVHTAAVGALVAALIEFPYIDVIRAARTHSVSFEREAVLV